MSFLFKAQCTSIYGNKIWFDVKINNDEYDALAVAYHNAMKKRLPT